jgi:hypothetical protein
LVDANLHKSSSPDRSVEHRQLYRFDRLLFLHRCASAALAGDGAAFESSGEFQLYNNDDHEPLI